MPEKFAKLEHSEIEGVRKYRLEFTPGCAADEDIRCLNVWRSILFSLGLIGQDPARYQGYGFGNISQRCAGQPDHFLISGTQTGHIPVLSAQHYVEVEDGDIALNRVRATGRVEPSSEALTHAMFYQLDADIGCVIHVHSRVLWRFGLRNHYPASGAEIEYGTPAMAQEIKRLLNQTDLPDRRTLVMAGHEDGLICFGDSVDQAGTVLLQLCTAVFTHATGRLPSPEPEPG